MRVLLPKQAARIEQSPFDPRVAIAQMREPRLQWMNDFALARTASSIRAVPLRTWRRNGRTRSMLLQLLGLGRGKIATHNLP